MAANRPFRRCICALLTTVALHAMFLCLHSQLHGIWRPWKSLRHTLVGTVIRTIRYLTISALSIAVATSRQRPLAQAMESFRHGTGHGLNGTTVAHFFEQILLAGIWRRGIRGQLRYH